MIESNHNLTKKTKAVILSSVFIVSLLLLVVALWVCSYYIKAEAHARYVGVMNVASEKIAKTVSGMEMNAMNVFDEVQKHMDTSEAVIDALKSKTNLNPDVRGYFAAFELDYFPEKGKWFEPYVHQTDSSSEFQMTQVGSARHNYTKSDWYVRAQKSKEGFWSDPYYYYDGTDMSGHSCTFVEPVFDATGRLACVCGADITFDWLTKELQRIDEQYQHHESLNKYVLMRNLGFFSVVVDHDGSCLIHPDNKKLPIKDKGMLQDLADKQSGTIDIVVDGVPSTLYYGPIEGIDWTMVIVAPKDDVRKPLLTVGLVLLAVAVVGIILAWIICRRIRYAEE